MIKYLDLKRINDLYDAEIRKTIGDVLDSGWYLKGEATRRFEQHYAALPAKQRAVFNMKYFQEMKYEDIASITGTSVGALKASYHLAVKKIEDFFSRYD